MSQKGHGQHTVSQSLVILFISFGLLHTGNFKTDPLVILLNLFFQASLSTLHGTLVSPDAPGCPKKLQSFFCHG
jgi:hypothetical protein